MADKTRIEWVRNAEGDKGATWNVVTGCSLISPGCSQCYAMRIAGTRLKNHPSRAGLTRDTRSGPVWTGEVRFNEMWLEQPLRWKKPRAIFVAAHGDLFHPGVSDEVLDKIFAVMALTPQHTYQVLTKRSGRMRAYVSDISQERTEARLAAMRALSKNPKVSLPEWPLKNVWLGVSVEDQRRANDRIPDLLMTPAAIRWISAEPLLGEIYLAAIPMTLPWRVESGTYNALDGVWTAAAGEMDCENRASETELPKLDWVVVGGENAPDALPMLPRWARSLRDQCAAAKRPFFFKQWGTWHTNAILMSTGEAVFRQFTSYEQWVAKAATWIRGGICLDNEGRNLKCGKDMKEAEAAGRFPVTIMHRMSKRQSGNLLDGRTHEELPVTAGTDNWSPLPPQLQQHDE